MPLSTKKLMLLFHQAVSDVSALLAVFTKKTKAHTSITRLFAGSQGTHEETLSHLEAVLDQQR